MPVEALCVFSKGSVNPYGNAMLESIPKTQSGFTYCTPKNSTITVNDIVDIIFSDRVELHGPAKVPTRFSRVYPLLSQKIITGLGNIQYALINVLRNFLFMICYHEEIRFQWKKS